MRSRVRRLLLRWPGAQSVPLAGVPSQHSKQARWTLRCRGCFASRSGTQTNAAPASRCIELRTAGAEQQSGRRQGRLNAYALEASFVTGTGRNFRPVCPYLAMTWRTRRARRSVRPDAPEARPVTPSVATYRPTTRAATAAIAGQCAWNWSRIRASLCVAPSPARMSGSSWILTGDPSQVGAFCNYYTVTVKCVFWVMSV